MGSLEQFCKLLGNELKPLLPSSQQNHLCKGNDLTLGPDLCGKVSTTGLFPSSAVKTAHYM